LINPAFHEVGSKSQIIGFVWNLGIFENFTEKIEKGFTVYEFSSGHKILRIHFPPKYILNGRVPLVLIDKPNEINLKHYIDESTLNNIHWIMYAYSGCCLTSPQISDFDFTSIRGYEGECSDSRCHTDDDIRTIYERYTGVAHSKMPAGAAAALMLPSEGGGLKTKSKKHKNMKKKTRKKKRRSKKKRKRTKKI